MSHAREFEAHPLQKKAANYGSCFSSIPAWRSAMRRLVASLVSVFVLAAVPVLASAEQPTVPHDCAKKCDCAGKAKSPTAPSQEPSDFVKSIWTGA